MLVDVVELRKRGERIPPDTVAKSRPVRGWFQLTKAEPSRHPGQAPLPVMALLSSDDCLLVLPSLMDARVGEVKRGASFVVHGIQRTDRHGRHPQSWWCRIVGAPEPPDGKRAVNSAGPQNVSLITEGRANVLRHYFEECLDSSS